MTSLHPSYKKALTLNLGILGIQGSQKILKSQKQPTKDSLYREPLLETI